MNSNAHRRLPPNARDSAIARVSGQTLSRYAGADSPLKLQITASEPAEPIELPAVAVNLLMQILEAIAAGRGVAVIPENTDAADSSRIRDCSRRTEPVAARLRELPRAFGSRFH